MFHALPFHAGSQDMAGFGRRKLNTSVLDQVLDYVRRWDLRTDAAVLQSSTEGVTWGKKGAIHMLSKN